MRRPRAVAFGLCLALTFAGLVFAPAPLEAQGRTCQQVLPSDFRRIINASGEEVIYFGDPVRFLCSGNVRLESDSAVVNRGSSTFELVGRVVYRDSTRQLTADWANYLGPQSQLLARGSTVVRDLSSGAVVEGENLNYLRATVERPIARAIVTGGRPHAVIPPQRAADESAGPGEIDGAPEGRGETPGRGEIPGRVRPVVPRIDADSVPPGGPLSLDPDTASSPTEIWADRMELEGDDLFRAQGNVELERGTMVGGGESAVFDQSAEQMTLTREAFVETDDYRLEGNRIDAFLEGDGLREVHSDGQARLVSEELNVQGERVRIGFDDGRVERLEAWNRTSSPATPRARADARDFRLRADSIHAQADSVGIRELRAVGRAYGERDVPVDSAAPAPERAVPAALSSDWLQGDTVLAFFAAPVAADAADAADTPDRVRQTEAAEQTDAVESERVDDDVVLERIEVVGGENPALSLYRMASRQGDAPPSVNFMSASRIVLFMEQGEVARVEAEGPIEGLYLDPVGREASGEARPAPGGAPGRAEQGGRGS